MLNRWNLLLSIVFLGLCSLWYYIYYVEVAQTSIIQNSNIPEYTGENMRTIVFDKMGRKHYVSKAKLAKYFNFDGHSEFTAPTIDIFAWPEYLDEPVESWKLQADNASLHKDNMLYLEENVLVTGLLLDSKIKSISTEQANINLDTNDIYSDRMVRIYGQNFVTKGLKFEGNLNTQFVNIKEQVETSYEINKQ